MLTHGHLWFQQLSSIIEHFLSKHAHIINFSISIFHPLSDCGELSLYDFCKFQQVLSVKMEGKQTQHVNKRHVFKQKTSGVHCESTALNQVQMTRDMEINALPREEPIHL